MSIEKIDIGDFLSLSPALPVIDVRSPGEYNHAHLPCAFNVPIFTDEQRAVIGTAYKKEGRHIAVDHGLEFFSERMKIIPGKIEDIIGEKKIDKISSSFISGDKKKDILVYCWRGGMRSAAIAWLMSLYGNKIYLLNGGYKSFRKWVLSQFEKKYSLKVLGGYTGSGKTEILKKLKKNGKVTIDLEDLANHKGSAFGGLGEDAQPSSEMFENLLAVELYKANAATQNNQEIWIEDESAHIGRVGIPRQFWNQMRESPLYFIDIDFEERVNYIVKNYGKFDKQELTNCILKIQKRLGGLNTKNSIQFLSENSVKEAFSILVKYYDKMYEESLNRRDSVQNLVKRINYTEVNFANADKVLDL